MNEEQQGRLRLARVRLNDAEKEVAEASNRVETLKREIQRLEKMCNHEWGEAVYDKIWTRTCSVCKKAEKTVITENIIKKVPKWP